MIPTALPVLSGLASEASDGRATDTSLDEVRRWVVAALLRRGAAADVADTVCAALLDSELEGLPSHGLLRLPEYVAEIDAGRLVPAARPRVVPLSHVAFRIDGGWGFGALSADLVQRELCAAAASKGIAVAGLANCNHLGRLSPILRPLARAGLVGMAFLNYRGAGQRVVPWGGTEGRLCTNPLAFAFPGANQDIVVDMSTSAVAEGKIRAAAAAGASIPEGCLVDAEWRPVSDPNRLYAPHPSAAMAPLGGPLFGYKGTALALVAEVLAGIIAGGGFVGPGPSRAGNGGFFLALRADLLGVELAQVRAHAAALAEYLESCPSAPGFERVRLPGQARVRRGAAAEPLPLPLSVRLPRELLCTIRRLAFGDDEGDVK